MKKLFSLMLAIVMSSMVYAQCTGDCSNGYGKMVYADGNSYEGVWKNGQMHGVGTLMLAGGVRYYGEFQIDQMHGYGVVYDANGGVIKSGIWTSSELTSNLSESETVAIVKSKDQSPPTGCVEGNCENGFGRYIYDDGNSYAGNWRNSMKNGYGILKLAGGVRYEGEFSDDNLHGQGIVYGADGAMIQCGKYSANELQASLSEPEVKNYLQQYK